MKERKRKIALITVIGVMLFSCVATLSYALWERLFTQSDENKITTLDCFDITYSNESAATTLNGAVPIKEEEGLKLTPYKVTIKNTCDTTAKYNVILNKKKGSTLDNKFVRTAVDKKTILLSDATQIETRKITNYEVDSSYIIGSGFVIGKKEKTINIRSWMDWETQATEGQNKTFTYKITIETGATNEEPTMLGDIILLNNSIKYEEPDFYNSYPASNSETEKSGLYAAMDDDGESYYFRGKIDNNYVKVADRLWRIVRINGDKSIRIILNEKEDSFGEIKFYENQDQPKYVGYTYGNTIHCTLSSPCTSNYIDESFVNSEGVGEASNIKTELEKWYQTNLSQDDKNIALTTFCNDTSYGRGDEQGFLNFAPSNRIGSDGVPSLQCPNPTDKNGSARDYGGVYKLKIGLLTSDEASMAGLAWSGGNTNLNYLYHNYNWWTMSPYGYEGNVRKYVAVYSFGGGLDAIIDSAYILPVINLKEDVSFTTVQPDNPGTINNPYIIQ